MSSRKRWLERGAAVAVGASAVTVIGAGTASAACEPWEMVAGAVGGNPACLLGASGDAALTAAKRSVLDDVAKAITDGVTWAAGAVGDSLKASGAPDINEAWFQETYQVTLGIGAMFAMIALACAMIYAGLTRDGREIGRSLAQVLVAGVSTGMIGTLVLMANAFIDYICDLALGADGWKSVVDSLKVVAETLNKAAAQSNNPTDLALPAAMIILIGVLMLLALCVIWAEMLIRRIAVDLCVAFWPLAVAGSIWPKARQWQHRLADTLLTVLLAKPVIVITLKMGSDALQEADSAADLIVACGLYALAALAPYLIMQMIGIIGGATQPGGSGQGLRQAGIGGIVGLGASAAMIATTMAKAGSMQAGGRTPAPSTAGQAAAGQTSYSASRPNTGASFGDRLAALGHSQRPALGSAENPADAKPVLEGRVIPGQLAASPARAALPPGPSGSADGGSPPSPAPSAPPSNTGGSDGNRYTSAPRAPIALAPNPAPAPPRPRPPHPDRRS
ncbi:type IV secretion system protein [Streptomyces sp. NPDC059193]|uniref:type IV secretion system protein n=1 Tax=Streptomyces sp. NPDC059193 TaxID=3346763 RepID=UPI0036884079